MWEDCNKGILQAFCSIEGKSAHSEFKDDGKKQHFRELGIILDLSL